MPPEFQIRADFDAASIVVYQAYPDAIADAAVANQTFVPPFSFQRMTRIKPSYQWLMHRSNWAQKSGQERILAVRITRSGWESALSRGVLTHFDAKAHLNQPTWADLMEKAEVHVQWDPERSLRGSSLQYRSIQVGIGRHLIRVFADEWITGITDLTPLTTKIRNLLRTGNAAAASRLLPPERPMTLSAPHLLLP